MELAVFIQIKTDEVAAELFGVKKRTVSSWRRLERAPEPEAAFGVIEATSGLVDWEGIYKPYVKNKKRKAKKAEVTK